MSNYMFLEKSETLASELNRKYDQQYRHITQQGLYTKWFESYKAYYGDYFGSNREVGIKKLGEQGEFAGLAINHFRNIIKHILNMATDQKLVFDPIAETSDIKARNDTKVTAAVLDHYFGEQKLDKILKDALELALVFGTAYLGVLWEPNSEIVGVDGDGAPVYRGKPNVRYYTVYDVVVDSYKDDERQWNWVVTREMVNKWDLSALYPEAADKVLNLPRITELQGNSGLFSPDEDSVWLMRAYHKPTPALPGGRYTIFCENDLVLKDGDNPYATLPIIPLIPEKRYGMVFGHTIAFDMLPIQDTINFLHSTILSNQQAFGTQNITSPKEAAVNVEDLDGGLKHITYRFLEGAPNGGAPEALELCKTPAEIFNYQDIMVKSLEYISGVNSATRGAPQNSLTSATAIALVNTSAQNFNNAVEKSYITAAEETATLLIKFLRAFLPEDEIITIAGKSNIQAVRSFKSSDLNSISRVRIQVGNPLAKTLAGRLEIANNLLQQGALKNPAQYLQVLESGTVEPIIDEGVAEENLIREENDVLLEGTKPQMIWVDNHSRHIEGHKQLLNRINVRENQQVVQVILEHIQEHTDQLEMMAMQNPIGLAIALNQPIPMPQPGGAPPPGQPGQQPGGQGGQPPTQLPEEVKAQMDGTQSMQNAAAPQGSEALAASAERRAQKLQASLK